MADDKNKQGEGDRSRVAEGEDYELDYLVQKYGLSRSDARALVDEVGNDREKLDAAVAARDGSGGNGASASRGAPEARRAAPRKPASGDRRPRADAGRSKRAVPAQAPALATRMGKLPEQLAEAATSAQEQLGDVAEKANRAVKRSAASAGRKVAAAPRAARNTVATAARRAKGAVKPRTAAVVGAAAAGLAAGIAITLSRKAVVQAPSLLAGDWLEALKAEHALALGILDRLQATKDTQSSKRSTLLAQLKRALSKHAFTEENVIYPAIRDRTKKADADKLNHDHGYVKQYLYDLGRMPKVAPEFLSKVAAFRGDLEEHIRLEESRIFPALRSALNDEENAALTTQANKEGFKLA
ncbi:hemerythrin domain-containing protein [Rhizorhabdus argentea]|uniref:hemerythrin domain-containing protein n=1 Tax=Rhizorhabdus argentea TaxID=1387174 RepID=UPI0030EE4CE1